MMNRSAPSLPSSPPANGRGVRLLCGLGGGLCAVAIFSALAFSRVPRVEPEFAGEVYVARQVTLPVETPPPDTSEPVEMVSATGPLRLEMVSSNSSVQIQVPEVPVLAAAPIPPPARPAVTARFALTKSAVAQPRVETAASDARRIFETRDVDQPPVALDRVRPRITYSDASAVETPRTTMLLIVDTDGTVGDVRILRTSSDEYFDARMVEAIRQWKFSPAVRKGRKVRCWVQQSITVQLSTGSRLTLN